MHNLLVHRTFADQSKAAIARVPNLEQKLVTALEAIRSSPASGKAMTDIVKPSLQGKIRRRWVGGRQGHRLIYLFLPSRDVVMPVYISEEPKMRFNYDSVEWEALADEIYQDFREQNYGAFINWVP